MFFLFCVVQIILVLLSFTPTLLRVILPSKDVTFSAISDHGLQLENFSGPKTPAPITPASRIHRILRRRNYPNPRKSVFTSSVLIYGFRKLPFWQNNNSCIYHFILTMTKLPTTLQLWKIALQTLRTLPSYRKEFFSRMIFSYQGTATDCRVYLYLHHNDLFPAFHS